MRRYPWLVVSLLAVVGVLLLGAFPTRAYLEQNQQRRELAARVAALREMNERLAAEAAHLQTDEAVERLARERYQLVRPGEEAYAILPAGEAEAVPTPALPPPPPHHQSWLSRVWTKLTSIL